MPAHRQVVITGLGVVSPLGNSKQALWEALCSGRSGVVRLDDWFPTAGRVGAPAQFSGSIDDFGPLEPELKKAIRKGLKLMCRECQMGVAAAQLALADAGLRPGTYDPDRCGVVFGADYMLSEQYDLVPAYQACISREEGFDFSRWAHQGMPQLSPLWLLKYLPNMPASHVAIYNDLRGPNNSLTLREASANLAVGEAFRTIVRGHAECMVAGATGSRIHPMRALHAVIQEEVAADGSDPAGACRPFDLHRQGMVLGEGAAAVVLEERCAAIQRGATIYARVAGMGSSHVSARNGVARRSQALTHALAAALREADLAPELLGHVQAHGLATHSCDIEEYGALERVLGRAVQRIPVTAAKSYFGNLGAASGLVELVAGVLALLEGRLFPILNYATPDPACPIAAVRPGTQADPGRSFANLSVTPQGQASCLVVCRDDGGQ